MGNNSIDETIVLFRKPITKKNIIETFIGHVIINKYFLVFLQANTKTLH
jgi:hypothetical protein